MTEIGVKIRIEVDEPWDSDKKIYGTVIRSLNSRKYWVIQEFESNQLFIVSCRYKEKQLSDVISGVTVIVGIAIPLAEIDLFSIPEITSEEFISLNYGYIGRMNLIEAL